MRRVLPSTLGRGAPVPGPNIITVSPSARHSTAIAVALAPSSSATPPSTAAPHCTTPTKHHCAAATARCASLPCRCIPSPARPSVVRPARRSDDGRGVVPGTTPLLEIPHVEPAGALTPQRRAPLPPPLFAPAWERGEQRRTGDQPHVARRSHFVTPLSLSSVPRDSDTPLKGGVSRALSLRGLFTVVTCRCHGLDLRKQRSRFVVTALSRALSRKPLSRALSRVICPDLSQKIC